MYNRLDTIVLVLFLCLFVGASVAEPPSQPTLITDIPGTTLSLFAAKYDHDILRLTVKPKSEWAFEVPHVIVPAAQPEDAIKAACDGSHCTIAYGDCVAKTDLSEVLTASISCSGVQLSTTTIYFNETPAAHIKLTFPNAKTMYGLAEHAADLPLRQGSTYAMYNTDAFKYSTNSTAALYGSIPFVMAYSATATTGVLFLNSAVMNVNISSETQFPSCDWEAEVGLVDLFFLPGATPAKVQRQHSFLTGTSVLPPYFSLGYHQCRWNYMSTNDCLSIDEGFDRHDMPYDALWLDIEHTDKKKYFTWDTHSFPDPKVLTDALASKGRKLVTIKDPHVKYETGYFVYDEGKKGDYFIMNSEGTQHFAGQCWPGTSAWPDFLNTRTRSWYAEYFHDSRYPGGSRDIHTWVDMNEPSVFSSSTKNTMSKEALHVMDDGRKIEHRYIHNMYSLLSIMSVYNGTVEAGGPGAKKERPFILTRSFFPGTQRYAAMWNGDNMATWGHLESTAPELLSISISNYAFCGCDVGGFFYDPEEELFVRWMQAGVFYPFLRSHAHLETKRHEPWTFSEEAQQHLRNALALRYALIPYLYTVFYHAHAFGETVMRPLIYEFPRHEELREVQDTYMFGPSLLVHPVVMRQAKQVTIPLPEGTTWYHYRSGEAVKGGAAGYTMAVELDTIPLFVRAGHIVPVKLRRRRSTYAARFDPFTLFVALNAQGNAHGDVYLDDGTTFDYRDSGAFAHRQFVFSDGKLSCTVHPDSKAPDSTAHEFPNTIERVVIYGYAGKPSTIYRTDSSGSGATVGTPLEYERVAGSIVVRKPDVLVTDDWTIIFENE